MDKKTTQKKPEKKEKGKSLLGFDTAELAGLSVADLVNNNVAIQMLLHYYRQLSEENQSLNNEVNTLKTYQSAYDRKTSDTITGAILLLLSNVLIAFAVNILTEQTPGYLGYITLGIGLLIAIVGVYFNFLKNKE